MTKTQRLIIGGLASAVIIVFACLAFLFVSLLPFSSPQAQEVPTVFVPIPITRSTPIQTATATEVPRPAPILTATATEVPRLTSAQTATAMPTARAMYSKSIPPRKNYRHSFRIQETYDRIRGITTVTLLPPADFSKWSKSPSNLLVTYEYPGTNPTSPRVVGFLLTSLIWYYDSCYDVNLLLNGETRISPPTILFNQTLPGETHSTEFITALLPLNDFLEIVNAKQVDGEVCNVQFALSQEQMEALRDVASRMAP